MLGWDDAAAEPRFEACARLALGSRRVQQVMRKVVTARGRVRISSLQDILAIARDPNGFQGSTRVARSCGPGGEPRGGW